ncbi:MAG: DUF1015 domain-containing protein [Clostridia bacterium]|nr:DUF1015 domain-containing protein [Clostridia bacterium]
MDKFHNDIGVCVPEILLPNNSVDMQKWAVVACDQYTSQPDYWKETEAIVGDSPSTLRIMLPEFYLDKPDEAERITAINAAMDRYMAEGVLESIGQGLMLVRRHVDGKTRLGLMIALDLERYSYEKGSKTLIRATEGTIVERIPPRLRIRKDAPLEMPHILVLIDDPDKTVIEPLEADAKKADLKYDFTLMQNGGTVKGWFMKDEAVIERTLNAMAALVDPAKFAKQYGADQPPLLFAMGDGNHSFATAKASWENIKATLSPEEQKTHPARFCLVELENVHDAGIIFEPIHRVLFHLDADKALGYLQKKMQADNGGCELMQFFTREEAETAAKQAQQQDAHIMPFVTPKSFGFLKVTAPAAQLEVGTLQNALDAMLKDMPGATIDYIHGEDVVYDLGSKAENMGFLLPPMPKSQLFPTVVFDGALPRKTFSMGEAHEKRYYLECKKIK